MSYWKLIHYIYIKNLTGRVFQLSHIIQYVIDSSKRQIYPGVFPVATESKTSCKSYRQCNENQLNQVSIVLLESKNNPSINHLLLNSLP